MTANPISSFSTSSSPNSADAGKRAACLAAGARAVLPRSVDVPALLEALGIRNGTWRPPRPGSRSVGRPWESVLTQGISGLVMAEGRPFRTADYLADPRISHDLDELIRAEGITGALAVPVIVNGRVMGVLCAGRREAGPFTWEADAATRQFTFVSQSGSPHPFAWLGGLPVASCRTDGATRTR